MKRKEPRHCFHTFGEAALGGKSLRGTSLKKIPFYVIFEAYCDMTSSGQAWTLIARFSNNDTKNWMKDNGEWWYDKSVAVGKGISPSENTDMLSPAFWLVSGLGFKITRSDDPRHTALLQTKGNCLGKQTFRQKIKSYVASRMVQFGQATSAWEIAVFNMKASFKQPMDLVKLHAVDHFRTKHKLASGATKTVVVERC